MAKLTLNDLTSLSNENSAVTRINNNNALIETALENTLSRDGTSPNTMSADLDMNSNQILNLPAATTDTEPVRKAEFDDAISSLTADGIALPTSGLVSYNATAGTAAARTFQAVVGSGITITNGDGVSGDPTFDFDSSTVTFTTALDAIKNLTPAVDKLAYYTGATTAALTDLSSFGRTLIDDANASAARTTLGVVIGTDVQAQDAELAAIAGLTSAADKLPYFTGSGTAALADFSSFGRSLVDDASASAARTTLGVVIGTDVQAQDAELSAIAGLVSAADSLPYFTGSGTAALTTLSSFGRTLIDDADATTARATLGLVIGTNVQAQDAELSALAGLTSAADTMPYFTGSGTAATTSFTSTARSLLDDTSTSAMRTTLGLAIGTDVQAYDAELAALASLTSAADALPYFTGAGTAATTTLTSTARSLLDDTTTSAMRTTLGLAIGTDVEAHDATLTALAGVTTAADKVIYATGIDTFATTDLTSTARSLLDDTSTSAMRTTLGLAIGTDVQAYDAELAALAGLTSAADALPYFTGSGTASTTTLSSFARTFIDDADAKTFRSTTGTKPVVIAKVTADSASLSTGDGQLIFAIDSSLNGRKLTDAQAFVSTAATVGTPTIQIRNITQTNVDILSTAITIDTNENTSYTATTPSVINSSNATVSTGDLIAVDVDVAGTSTGGLGVILTFE